MTTPDVTEKPSAQIASTPRTGSASPDKCNCLHEKDNALREKGYKIADVCLALVLTENTLTARYGLPLARLKGERMKRTDPRMITISHCPFCGKKL
jgi:uncharacterized protein (DUF427 family)